MPALKNLQLVASSLMLLLTAQLILLSGTVEGFHNNCVSRLTSTTTFIRERTTIFNSNNNEDEDEDDDSSLSMPLSSTSSQLEQGNFNPFDYKTAGSKSSRSSGSAPPRVDIRSIRMGSLTTDLLNSLGDEAVMRTILEDNRDFLLEPLEVEDSLAVSCRNMQLWLL